MLNTEWLTCVCMPPVLGSLADAFRAGSCGRVFGLLHSIPKGVKLSFRFDVLGGVSQ